MNLIDILSEHANFRADQTALIDSRSGKDRSITFRQLEERVKSASQKLGIAGVKKNSRVLIAVSLSIETYVILLALFRIGAVAVIADASLGFQTLEQSVSMVKPDAVIFDSRTRFLCMLSAAIKNIRLKISSDKIVTQVQRDTDKVTICTIEDVGSEHPALITYTSGSTGTPKAIVRTHGFLQHQQEVIAKSLPPQPSDIELTTLPVFVLSALSQGITAILPDCNMRKPASINAARIAAQIDRCQINRIIASPAFLQTLSDFLIDKKITMPSLRRIYTGGGPVFPALLKQLQMVFPNAELTTVYGSTEAEPIAHSAFQSVGKDDLAKTFSGGGLLAGKPIAEIELRIGIEKLPPYKIGEILVSGKHVVKTYLNGIGNAETKIVIGSGSDKEVWHRTGDAGYLDKDGRLWLMGRCSSKISDKRGEIYPFQVEAAGSEINSIRRVTCMKSNGRRILLVERRQSLFHEIASAGQTSRKAFLDTIRAAFSWLQYDEIRVVRAIPVDMRHNAKIQYSQVEFKLSHDFPWTWGRVIHHSV